MSDAETIKKLEAQLQVQNNNVKKIRERNKTLELKASKWQIAKEAGVQFDVIKSLIDNMKVEGLSLGNLSSFNEMKKVVDDFVDTYGKKL